MPYTQVMPKFGAGTLYSGSKNGPKVGNPKQAVAIILSEKRKAQGGKSPLNKAMGKVGGGSY